MTEYPTSSSPLRTLSRLLAVLLISVAAGACQTPETPKNQPKSSDPEGGQRLVSVFISTPPGAKLTIDGVPIGRTDIGAALPDKDELVVTLEKSGYRKVVDTITRDGLGWHDSYSYVLQRK